jgi:hypothetical protein
MSRSHPWEVSDALWGAPIPGSIVPADSWFVGRKNRRITWHSFIWLALNSFLPKSWFSDKLLVGLPLQKLQRTGYMTLLLYLISV